MRNSTARLFLASSAGILVAGAFAVLSASGPDPGLVGAVKAGYAGVVRSLLEKRADAGAADRDGTTALTWAVRLDDRETASLLIGAGAALNSASRYGVTPLGAAARNGSRSLLSLLIESGADTHAADRALPDGQTLLMLAARAGSVESVKLLIQHGEDVNARERRVGATPLIWAAAEDRAAVVHALIEAGADVNGQSSMTRYPHTPPSVIGDPLEEGVSYVGQTVLPKGGWTPLMYAARQGALETARVLIDSHADLNLTDPDGTSALLFAVINGHYDVAALLLDRGADPNLPDKTGMTALYAAVDMHTVAFTFGRPDPTREVLDGAVGAIRTLLSHGANPNAALKTRILKRVYNAGDPRLSEGATPFMRAARSADVPVMKLLLASGADPRAVQTNGNSPVMLAVAAEPRRSAAERGDADDRLEAIRVCLEAGVDVNASNGAGDTAAHLAATTRSGSPEILQLLSERGAALAVKNKAGRTPLDAALRARDVSADTVASLRRLTGDQGTTEDVKAPVKSDR